MADTQIPETPTQRQARLRREKRERKILEGGASRLDKITRTSGRPADSALATPASTERPENDSTGAEAARVQAQLPEVPDAGSHNLPTSNPQEAEAALRHLLRNSGPDLNTPPFGTAGEKTERAQEVQEEDPMMRLLQQLMGMSQSSAQSDPNFPQSGGVSPEVAAALGGGSQGSSLGRPAASANSLAWKVLHAMFALALGIYVLACGPSLDLRSSTLQKGFLSPPDELNVFWAFVTIETGLQAARYLLEGEKETSGAVGMLAGFLPSPWKDRLLLASRYTGIWTTLVEDAMVIVWLFGVAAWWNASTI